MTSFRDRIGAESVEQLHRNLDEMLDGEAGWVIIADMQQNRVCDAYMGVCDTCVAHTGSHIIANAVATSRVMEHAVAKMAGHKHFLISESDGPRTPRP